MSKLITNVPCGPGQCNGLWQNVNNLIHQSTMLNTSRGGYSTVPGIRSTKYQSCTNEWTFDAPFGPEQVGRCQAPIDPILGNSTRRSHMRCRVCILPCQAPFTGALLHEEGNRSWLINLPKSYSFIYLLLLSRDPGNCPRRPITRILFIIRTITITIPVSMWAPSLRHS